jgi:hypothetical protein
MRGCTWTSKQRCISPRELLESGGALALSLVWSDGTAITLGALPGANANQPLAINDAGQVVGFSGPVNSVPEPSTWAMMLLGFAVLGYAGYRRSARVLGQNAPISISQPDV